MLIRRDPRGVAISGAPPPDRVFVSHLMSK
jgi:hypothetical protein